MTARTVDRPAATEFEIETRGMAKAVDLLMKDGQGRAANLLLEEISRRIARKEAVAS